MIIPSQTSLFTSQVHITSSRKPTSKIYSKKLLNNQSIFNIRTIKNSNDFIFMTNMSSNHRVDIKGFNVDNNGNSYVVGDFLPKPPLNYYSGYYYDIFVSKFNSTGSLDFISYLGGSSAEHIIGWTIDSSGNIYIIGTTGSNDFPTTDNTSKSAVPVTSTFVAEFNTTGGLAYSTILGNYEPQIVHIHLVADNSGNLFITIQIYLFNTELRVKNNFTNMTLKNNLEVYYLAKLDSKGQLLFSDTFPAVIKIATDKNSNCIIIGSTIVASGMLDFPVEFNTDFNVFVIKLDPEGKIIFNHVLGGSTLDYPSSIGLDSAGNLYVYGITNSKDFPLKLAYYKTLPGSFAPFETKFDPNGSILFSTYIDKVIDPYSLYPELSILVDHTGNSYFMGAGKDNGTFISKFNNNGEEQYTFNDTHNRIFSFFLNTENNNIFFLENSYQLYLQNQNSKPFDIYHACDSYSDQQGNNLYVKELNDTGNLLFSLYLGNSIINGQFLIRSNNIFTISRNCFANSTAIYLYRSKNILTYRYNPDNSNLLDNIIKIAPPAIVVVILSTSLVLAIVESRKLLKKNNMNASDILAYSKSQIPNFKAKITEKRNKESSSKNNLDLIEEIIDENKDKIDEKL